MSDWVLTAPDGRQWRGDRPLRACAAAQRDTIDPVLAMQRINAMVAEETAIRDKELTAAYASGRADEREESVKLLEALRVLLLDAVVLSDAYLEAFRDWPADTTIQG